MVDLFNRIDEASRSDLRAFNEQNALRFEARLDQRYAELDAKIDTKTAEILASVEKALHAQTRWMIGAWVVVIGMVLPLWFR